MTDSYDLDPYYWDFGNGYVPFFLVVGNQNLVIYGDNPVAGAIDAVDDAINTFNHLFALGSIDDQTLSYNSQIEIDLTDLFFDPNGNDITIFVTGNTDPAVVGAEVVGDYLILTSYSNWGEADITVTGMGGTDAAQIEFNVIVVPNTMEISYEVDDSPEQQEYPNNQNPFENSLVDLGWTQIEATESNPLVYVRLELTWNSLDYPTEGSLHLTSPSGTEVLIYESTAEGPTELEIILYDFAGEDMMGTWDLYILDAFSDGGHMVTDGTVNFGVASGTDADDGLSIPTVLKGNYPNPFNPVTTIAYSLKENSDVNLEVYNVKGQLVRTLISDNVAAGPHTIEWNGMDDSRNRVTSGVYYYKLNAGDYTSTKKMILLK